VFPQSVTERSVHVVNIKQSERRESREYATDSANILHWASFPASTQNDRIADRRGLMPSRRRIRMPRHLGACREYLSLAKEGVEALAAAVFTVIIHCISRSRYRCHCPKPNVDHLRRRRRQPRVGVVHDYDRDSAVLAVRSLTARAKTTMMEAASLNQLGRATTVRCGAHSKGCIVLRHGFVDVCPTNRSLPAKRCTSPSVGQAAGETLAGDVGSVSFKGG